MLDLTKVAPQVESMAQTIAEETSFAQALLHDAEAGRKTLVNLSPYPLPAGILAGLEKTQGQSIAEIRFPAQFDPDKPLRPQVAALIHKVECRLRILSIPALDYLVLPANSAAAYFIAEAFARLDAKESVSIVWLKRAGDACVLGGVE